MPASTSNVWARGFSENPDGELLHAKSIVEMLDLIGDELVTPPGAEPVGAIHPSLAGRARDESPLREPPLMTRREMLARVLWTRAIADADNAAAKLIIEYLDGKPGETEGAPGDAFRPAMRGSTIVVPAWLAFASLTGYSVPGSGGHQAFHHGCERRATCGSLSTARHRKSPARCT